MAHKVKKNHMKEVYKNLRKAGYNPDDSYKWIIRKLPKCNVGKTVGGCLNELIRESAKERKVY